MLPEKNIREGLFIAEPISPERQQRFREELAQILEPRLPRHHRWYYTGVLICILIGMPGAICGALFDPEHRWTWGLYLLAMIPAAGWQFHILRRGAEPLRAMQGMSKAFSGMSALAAIVLILYGIQNPSLTSVLWALLGLIVFLLANFINLWNRVITAERTTREHILRVEYRLADMRSRT